MCSSERVADIGHGTWSDSRFHRKLALRPSNVSQLDQSRSGCGNRNKIMESLEFDSTHPQSFLLEAHSTFTQSIIPLSHPSIICSGRSEPAVPVSSMNFSKRIAQHSKDTKVCPSRVTGCGQRGRRIKQNSETGTPQVMTAQEPFIHILHTA